MFQHENSTLYLGPPGTGKTTTLLNVVETEMTNGVPPDRIGFVSFTKKATTEAIDRACARFNLHERDFPFFRTLHSMAFQGIGASRGQVMQTEHLSKFGESIGEIVTGSGPGDDGQFGARSTRGDVMLFCDSLARTRDVSLYRQWQELAPDDVEWAALERFSRSLRRFKDDCGLLDFTDMLERYPNEGFVPKLEALIVDEAQDLSPLQWRVVDCMARRAKRVYIAGDDDQAIYRWAGADVETFLALGGLKHTLTTSHRLSRAVHAKALEVVRRIRHRYAKDFDPRDDDGFVNYYTHPDQVDMSDGTWLVLARNSYLLRSAEEAIRQRGWLYESKTFHANATDAVRAMVDWERLRRGRAMPLGEVRKIYKQMSPGVGVARPWRDLANVNEEEFVTIPDLKQRYGLLTDAIWHEALDRIPQSDRAYYVTVLRSGEKLTERPRIRVSTIHAAKGGEAENVLLYTDMSQRTWDDWQRHPDDEHRVFYVGATRAKRGLHIITPRDLRGYDL